MIHKFDYVFAENGTVQYKDGKFVSKHVSKHILHQVMHANSQEVIYVALNPPMCSLGWIAVIPSGHSEPNRGGAAAGSDQFLPQLHGADQTTQEKVRCYLKTTSSALNVTHSFDPLCLNP